MKLLCCSSKIVNFRRSREGAWIEILYFINAFFSAASRSREGAWIEIYAVYPTTPADDVAPARERGLKFWLS